VGGVELGEMVRIAAATISADPLGTWAKQIAQKMHPTSLPPIYCSKGLLFTRKRLAVVGNHWQGRVWFSLELIAAPLARAHSAADYFP
jgi:hypothetical protein